MFTEKFAEKFEDHQESIMKQIAFVEKHDDLFPSDINSYIRAIVYRTWYTINYCICSKGGVHMDSINTNWNKWYDGNSNVYSYFMEFSWEHWKTKREVDFSIYLKDKIAFAKKLFDLAQELLNEFGELQKADKPWWNGKDNNISYHSQCKYGDRVFSFTTKLGEIKYRGGRFQWFVIPTDSRSDWPVKEMKQGHAGTLEEAREKIESFWNIGV